MGIINKIRNMMFACKIWLNGIQKRLQEKREEQREILKNIRNK